jgi:hypothetical protein
MTKKILRTVELYIASSDHGDVQVCQYDKNNPCTKANYDLWLKGLKSSGKFWSIETLKADNNEW